MRMKSLIAGCATAATAAVCAVLMQAPPATAAAPSCTHTLEMYQSRYEVTANQYVRCSGATTYDWIITRVRITTPVQRGSGDQHCENALVCAAVVSVFNRPGTATYCATADGMWVFNESTGTPKRLPPISRCTVA
jgi:hypothetical protein